MDRLQPLKVGSVPSAEKKILTGLEQLSRIPRLKVFAARGVPALNSARKSKNKFHQGLHG